MSQKLDDEHYDPHLAFISDIFEKYFHVISGKECICTFNNLVTATELVNNGKPADRMCPGSLRTMGCETSGSPAIFEAAIYWETKEWRAVCTARKKTWLR